MPNGDMKWYYKIYGGHTHVRVFMNGAKCGDLCFRNEEFIQLQHKQEWYSLQKDHLIEFINETEQ